MHYLEEERQGAGFPWANHVLMGAMLCCFAYELTLGPAFQPFLTTYGWIPAQFSLALTQGQFPVSSSLFACLFLHGGGLHLVGNLLCLFFSRERRRGAVRSSPLPGVIFVWQRYRPVNPGGDYAVFLNSNDRREWGDCSRRRCLLSSFFLTPGARYHRTSPSSAS